MIFMGIGNKKCDEEKRRLEQSPERDVKLPMILSQLFSTKLLNGQAHQCANG
jgi:hypothetical protein